MKSIVLIAVFICIASTEPPVGRTFLRQRASPPYQPRGFRPSVPFNLPVKSQPQQTPPVPAPSYGPPPKPSYGPPPKPSYGPPPEEPTEEPTTTDNTAEEVTTETPQVENIEVEKKNGGEKKAIQPVFFVVPQRERLVYVPQSAPLVTYPSVSSSSIFTPYSAQFLQIVQ